MSLRCFALDIVQSHRESPSISNHSLFRMLFLLVKAKYSGSDLKSQIILIKDIRRIICERARKFFGFNEQVMNEDVLLMETLVYSNVGCSRVADSLLKHATI